MILYLDASSLIKLFIWESDSRKVETLVSGAFAIATSRIAYAETISAFRRLLENRNLTPSDFDKAIGEFRKFWPTLSGLDFDETSAADVSIRHNLRALDAIHLSTAISFLDPFSNSDVPAYFSSFDKRLNVAAQLSGLSMPD